MITLQSELKISTYQMVTLTDLNQIESIRDVWHEVARHNPGPFQSFDWNLAWYRNQAQALDSVVFVFKSEGETCAILPCYRSGGRLRLAGDDICDFQDLLATPNCNVETVCEMLLSHIETENLVIRFEKVRSNCPLYQHLKTSASRTGLVSLFKTVSPCPNFELSKDSEAFLKQAKTRVRKHTRRALRLLDKNHPGHRYEILEREAISEQVIREISDLHINNQLRKVGCSIFTDRRFIRFLDRIKIAPDVGLMAITLRDSDNQLMAFDLGFRADDCFYAYVGSYERSFANCSPGICLLNWEMDRFPELGIRIFDFLSGSESYKRNYASDSYDIMAVSIAVSSPVNRFIFSLRKTKRKAVAIARQNCPEAIEKLHDLKMEFISHI